MWIPSLEVTDMRHLWIFLLGFYIADSVRAADQRGVSKAIQKQVFDERFALIGVIAEGDGRGKGIAVIKDHKQNKTHTLKIGEVVPGQTDLTLTRVSRQVAVLHSSVSDIYVGVESATTRETRADSLDSKDFTSDYANNSNDEEKDGDDDEASGLFDKWYQNRAPAVLSEGRLRRASDKETAQDVPSSIRGRSERPRFDNNDDRNTLDSNASDDRFDPDAPPTRVEYSDEMRLLIDKYLSGEAPVSH
jgi:hypothetical protein